MIESYFLAAVYALFAVVSWFFFIHHPDEKQVVIKDERLSATDDTQDNNLNELRDLIADTQQQQNDIITPGYTRYAVANEVIDPSKNLEVTLLDALRLKEISLLIVSFLVRETHNRYILID